MTDGVRWDHVALGILGQIESAEKDVKEGAADAEVAAIAELRIIGVRRGMVPAMHFRTVPEIVEPAALGVRAAVGEVAIVQAD